MSSDMIEYYKLRAKEYDELYARPDRQEALQKASSLLKEIVKGKEVLEITCGTAYWTKVMAETAKHVHATDLNETMLDVARDNCRGISNITFRNSGLYTIKPKEFRPVLFCGFFWSHVEIEKLNDFVKAISKYVGKGGTMIFIDNLYVEGSSTPISSPDEYGNTYQARKLGDGTPYTILKNFPSEEQIRTVFKEIGTVEYFSLDYYWMISVKT
jgi:cyclopropane fatty-acyl-phospholipid synthase-like methyltransferase